MFQARVITLKSTVIIVSSAFSSACVMVDGQNTLSLVEGLQEQLLIYSRKAMKSV
jgi:hypothetical protein